ncbi:exodeoxyribonuclease VII small subunit [Facklamia sp. DSM 111018]|uniref:Exodeoxyribonuclease 7 small subunit n=1 Tax=Facklamia lactis TaxID=2749967 RepID=A0ABS0LRQ5_9LACT|nr:exodeoxyribonuclease VII small subunit [Facklamia lactis]MBG9980980.1 exodeoxyribonuclease VII small subunit [Facklamia lactis]MBG9986657.1 exodeoxyribonuclease VII small subunit [Facklamia lactis]
MSENLENINEPENFEAAMAQLETIVQELERGSLPLQDALSAFKQGVSLSQYCHKELNEAEKTVTQMMTESGLKPLDEERV